MKKSANRAIFSALASVAVAAPLIGLTATSASAINSVECGPVEYTEVVGHNNYGGIATPTAECFANGGEANVTSNWVTSIETGNNNVQYFANGTWQPQTPIPPHTDFQWPNNPGGVQVTKIRIV